MHVTTEKFIFFLHSLYKAFWSNNTCFLLLCTNLIQVTQMVNINHEENKMQLKKYGMVTAMEKAHCVEYKVIKRKE